MRAEPIRGEVQCSAVQCSAVQCSAAKPQMNELNTSTPGRLPGVVHYGAGTFAERVRGEPGGRPMEVVELKRGGGGVARAGPAGAPRLDSAQWTIRAAKKTTLVTIERAS